MGAAKPKIYVFCNSCSPEWHHMTAIAEDGAALTGHVCSHHGFAAHDMGFTSDWKHDVYNNHYPDGWELEWVDNPRPGGHAGFDAVCEKNALRTKPEARNE